MKPSNLSRFKGHSGLALLALLLALLLAACGNPGPFARPTPTATPLAVAVAPSAMPSPLPTSTPSSTPVPTRTSSPTVTPSLAPTERPTATPTPPHPLSIEAMRLTPYPGSDLVIEQELAPGSNYRRYLASYLSDGLKINGLLTVPQGEAPETGWPIIVFNHGYIPPSVYRTTERYVAYQDALARSGYIVLKPDYRGHADSEGKPSGAYGSPDYAVDVLNAVAALKRFPGADPGRIGMWGHSMGGHLTLRAMVVSADVKAGVIWAGVVAPYADLLSRWRRPGGATPSVPTSARRWRQEFTEQYGTPDENPAFWNAISPNSYLADLSGPIQLHHGTADTSVPIEFSEVLEQQIREAGGEVEFYRYDGDNHNISRSFSTAMQRTIEFFDRYVKNGG